MFANRNVPWTRVNPTANSATMLPRTAASVSTSIIVGDPSLRHDATVVDGGDDVRLVDALAILIQLQWTGYSDEGVRNLRQGCGNGRRVGPTGLVDGRGEQRYRVITQPVERRDELFAEGLAIALLVGLARCRNGVEVQADATLQ